NKTLLNLRKARHMSGLPRSRRTVLTRTEMDSCEYACEIAMQEFSRNGWSLDDLLCDPAEADNFDKRVRCIGRPELSSLHIRWTAFGIRKRAQRVRRKCASLEVPIQPPFPRLACELDFHTVDEQPGLYWLQSADQKRKLYVGKTDNLQQRLRAQIHE